MQTIRVSDLGFGLDTESAENRIVPGALEDVKNMDPAPSGQLETRKGYQGYAGNIPVRVKEFQQTTSPDMTCFILDNAIDLSSTRNQPIIVKGKNSVSTSGDFPSNAYTTRYYTAFTDDVKRAFATGTNTGTIPQSEHGISDSIIWQGAASSSSLINFSNSQFILDAATIDQATNDLDYTYTNGTGSSFDGFVFFKGRTTTAGTVYNSPITSILTGTNTYTISLATHALNNRNILTKAFQDTGTEYREILVDAVTVDDTTGLVSITITNGTGSAFNGILSLVSVPTANFATGNIGGQGSVTVTVPLTGNPPFAFVGCYLQNGTTSEQVIPDSIVADVDNNQLLITFQNQLSTGRIFRVFWEFVTIATNKLCVDSINPATIADIAPQLTIWGFDHSEIYGDDRSAPEGWVTHIDAYKSTGENRLVAGLGGNIFTAQGIDEGANATEHLMPTLYPRVNMQLSASTKIGPAFYDSIDTPTRTRGFIQGTAGGDNVFSISSINYDSGLGWVRIDLSVPNMSISGTLSTIIKADYDLLNVSQAGWAIHNGEFTIKQVTAGTNALSIWVANSSVTTSDYNITSGGGFAGIFTDHLPATGSTAVPFLPGDIATSGIFTEEEQLEVFGSFVLSGTPTIVLRNVTSPIELPPSLKVTAKRTSAVVPLRTLANVASVENVLRGDMLSYSQVNRLLRVKSINVNSDLAVTSITDPDGESALVTLGSGDTNNFIIGSKIILFGNTSYNSAYEISEILSGATFRILTPSLLTDAGGFVLGNTVEVDEDLTYEDTETSSTVIRVPSRWIPVEFPTDTYNLTPVSRIHYFDSNEYGAQPVIRSTMVQDNMYLTNGDDEVFKFDGTNIYRAGLFRWQPNLFVNVDTATSAGKIIAQNPSVSYTAVSNNKYTIALADNKKIQIGDVIKDAKSGKFYTVRDVDDDGTDAFILVNANISVTGGGATTITRVSSYKYYFRLNAVDANNNVLASAATGSEDFVVRIAEDGAVRIRLIGMPAWDVYDYDRLEVQLYRTKANQVAPFYHLSTIQQSFDTSTGYIDYVDADSDDDLIQLDEVNTSLKGQELGTAWTEPLRAKYVTSVDNRLVLANIKDYPQLDLQFLRNSTDITRTVLLTSGYTQWLFRKDNTDSLTTSNMLDRAMYEFRDTAGALTVSGVVTGASSFTVTTSVNHGLVAGDWVYLFHNAAGTALNTAHAGWWQVKTVPTLATFTVASVVTVPASTTNITRALIASSSGHIPVPIGDDYNYGMLNGNRDLGIATASSYISYEFLAMRRLADAINVSMRKVDKTLSAFSTFSPWMIASAGNEIGVGRMTVRQPRASTLTLELRLPALTSSLFDVYVNEVKRAGSSEASSLTRLFPSRLLISYPNYPEILDNPLAPVDLDSYSAVDVNSADGQEITAVIPFFGDSAFGAAQKSGVVVVFKTNSIYLVDASAKAQGQPAVQKLETGGQGCTAPYSVTVTKAGIILANESGIYRLGRDLQVTPVGRKYKRKWKDFINKDALSAATATHDADTNTYKLSYPVSSEDENSMVAVYNHTREEDSGGYGSWTAYTNHPATGWANLLSDSFFGSTTGRIFSIRKLNEVSDYRDDSSAIDAEALIGAMDFGDSGKRKTIPRVSTHYRVIADVTGATLSTAVNLQDSFDSTDAFVIERTTGDTGIGDTGEVKVKTIQSSIGRKRCVYVQLKYANNTKDEPLVITGIDYSVKLLSSDGIQQAVDTRS